MGKVYNNRYLAYSVNGYSASFSDFSQNLDTDGDGDESEYVYRVTVNSPPTGEYNVPIEFRLREINYDGTDQERYFD